MDVILSSDLTSGLKRLGNSTLVNDDVFTKLVDAGICTLTDLPVPYSVNEFCGSKGDVVKEAYSSLLSLLVESSRNSMTSDLLQEGLISSYGWSSSRAQRLSEIYRQSQSKLSAVLINVGTKPPHITDVSWRLDYCIQTNAVNSLSTPLFYIKLVTEGGSNINSNCVKFVCTQHELQDLISKLKDALRHVERIAATTAS